MNNNKIKRRSFLKYLGLGAFAGYFPGLYAQMDNTDADVQFLKRDHRYFDIYRKSFNKRIDLLPKIIAVCRTEVGVQKSIQYANSHDLPVSIKSGGHCFEGFSLNDDGLVVDLSNMSQLKLDVNNRLVSDPAVRLAQLYGYCLPKGRLLPSGSCGSVGLSGITLGGGYGLFSRQFGLTCDYLTGLRMIDAKAKVIDSNEMPELLWGCRGGGNGNFGVITQLRFDTASAPKTLHQHRFRSFKVDPKKASDLARIWFEQCDELPKYAFSAFVLNGSTLTVMLTATEHDDDMERVLKVFNQIMDNNANLKPDPLEVGVHYYYGHSNSIYFKNISGGYYDGFDDISRCIEELFTQVINTPGMIFQINTLGGEINNPSRLKASAYAHRNAGYLGEAQCYWEHPREEKGCMNAMKTVQDVLHKNNIRRHYVNYPDLNINNYEEAYYGESYKRLQNLKRVLDPENRFSYKQGIK